MLLRRIGEDELAAIATCRPLIAHAQNAPTVRSSSAMHLNAAGDGREVRFRGYHFLVLRDTRTPAPSSEPATGSDAITVVAYPAEYRVTGVLTFVAYRDGTVYEADLGAQTALFARALRGLDPTLDWRAIP